MMARLVAANADMAERIAMIEALLTENHQMAKGQQ